MDILTRMSPSTLVCFIADLDNSLIVEDDIDDEAAAIMAAALDELFANSGEAASYMLQLAGVDNPLVAAANEEWAMAAARAADD